MNYDIIIKTKINLLIFIFAFGRIISATGQTLFGVRHAAGYAFINGSSNPILLAIAAFAAVCSMWVILTTRIPAMARQFKFDAISQTQDEVVTPKPTFYTLLMFCSLTSGVFSAIGAYLATMTLAEFISYGVTGHTLDTQTVSIQLICAFTALSTFISYYSFNYIKSRRNVLRLLQLKTISFASWWQDDSTRKTMFISILSLVSIPFLSYFLTKHALLRMPLLGDTLSFTVIKYIAACSAITAFTTCLITNVPATYDYFIGKKHHSLSFISDDTKLLFLRNSTYFAGVFDCTANGLSNFVSVIDTAHDAFDVDIYGNIIILAIGCGISSALLTAAFSVRQGFNDFAQDYQAVQRA